MIRDLLNPSSGFLELREDGRGVVVAGISEVQAKKTSEVSINYGFMSFTPDLFLLPYYILYMYATSRDFTVTVVMEPLMHVLLKKGLHVTLHCVCVHPICIQAQLPVSSTEFKY